MNPIQNYRLLQKQTGRIADLVAEMPSRTYKSRAGFRAAVRRFVVKRTGCEPVSVATDRAGNCVVCGEAGRCCGLHLYGEVVDYVKRTTSYGNINP